MQPTFQIELEEQANGDNQVGHETEKLKKHVEAGLELVAALERAKTPAPAVIKQILIAMREGTEIAMSAEEASQHFAKFVKDLDRQCGIGDSTVNQDDAWVCLAKREGTEGSLSYAGRVNFVLNRNNPLSAISIHWSKKKRSGWGCVWDEIRNGSPSGLYRKCFIEKGSLGHIPKRM